LNSNPPTGGKTSTGAEEPHVRPQSNESTASPGYIDSILQIYRPFVRNSVESLEAFASGPLLYMYQAIKQNEVALLGFFGLFALLGIKILTDFLGRLFSKKV
jgi:hypothetical protein